MQSKKLLRELFQVALDEVSPQNLINRHCKLEANTLHVQADSYDLSEYENVYILGSGKAAHSMAKSMVELLGDSFHSGVIVAPECKEVLNKIECIEADHPIPSKRSEKGADALIQKMKTLTSNDLYIYLLSGGSSSLIEKPLEGICLEDFQAMTDLMLKAGLRIDEINAVRKHISSIKGGRLGKICDAKGIVLTVSDVIGDDLYSIGSAPLYADTSTYEDVVEILKSYELIDKIPESIKIVIENGLINKELETPKRPAKNITHYLIGTNILARKAVYDKACSLGLQAKMIEADIASDVTIATQEILTTAMNSQEKILIFGGEATVKVVGDGQGGRNQHAALQMLKLANEQRVNISFLSAGTDGIDGNSDAAGACIDKESWQQAQSKELYVDEYLKNFDSYHFFKSMDGLVMTGPTGTNVMDIAILIKEF